MRAFAASVLALPLLAAATEPVLAARGRRHHQRSLERMLQQRAHHSHRHHHSSKNATCSDASSSVDTPKKLADGSLDSEHGCVKYHTMTSDDTCSSIVDEHAKNMTVEQFIRINPSALEDCWGLVEERSYCIGVTDCLADGALTLDQNCTTWAQASSNDTYRSLAQNNNATLADLRFLNQDVGKIQEGSYYCVSNQTALDTEAPEWHSTWTADQKKKAAEASKAKAQAQAQAKATPTSSSNTWTPEATSTQQEQNTWTEQESSTTTPNYYQQQQQQQNTWTSTQDDWSSDSSSEAWTPESSSEDWTPSSSSEENTWTPTSSSESAEPTSQDNNWAQQQDSSSSEEQAAASSSEDSSSSSSSSGGTATGDATFFTPGLGYCGWTNSASDYIAAAPASLYAITGDSICGKSITLNYQGKSVTVEITDQCPECSTCSMDLSPSAFQQLADESAGRISVTWDASELGISASVC